MGGGGGRGGGDNLTCRSNCVIFCHLRRNRFWHFEHVNIKPESGMRQIQKYKTVKFQSL